MAGDCGKNMMEEDLSHMAAPALFPRHREGERKRRVVSPLWQVAFNTHLRTLSSEKSLMVSAAGHSCGRFIYPSIYLARCIYLSERTYGTRMYLPGFDLRYLGMFVFDKGSLHKSVRVHV